MARRVKKPKTNSNEERTRSVREVHLGEGLPSITSIRAELQDYWDVLLGRKEPPIDKGVATLMELADAYYARAMELTSLIHEAENDDRVVKGSSMYQLRTGELRDFTEMAKRAADLGSRRITMAKFEWEQKHSI